MDEAWQIGEGKRRSRGAAGGALMVLGGKRNKMICQVLTQTGPLSDWSSLRMVPSHIGLLSD